MFATQSLNDVRTVVVLIRSGEATPAVLVFQENVIIPHQVHACKGILNSIAWLRAVEADHHYRHTQ